MVPFRLQEFTTESETDMSDEIKTDNTDNPEPELSTDELDQVAGGYSFGASNAGSMQLKVEPISPVPGKKTP